MPQSADAMAMAVRRYAACLAASVYVEPAAVIMVPAPGYCRYGHGGHGPR